MVEMLAALGRFASENTIWVYLFIFLGKIIEVSMSTLRIVLINRGERIVGAVISLVEIMLWLIIAGSVLGDYKSSPLKMVTYAVAFAIGTYLGSWLEERLAFGLCSIQTVVMTREESKTLTAELRKSGFGVTEMAVEGIESTHYMLIMTLKRRLSGEAIALIQRLSPKAVITVSDVKTQKGGYLRNAGHRRLHRH